jgi:hypothetical protein
MDLEEIFMNTNKALFEPEILKLIKEFASSDVDEFVKNVLKSSRNHEDLFGVKMDITLGKHKCMIVSKYNGSFVEISLRSRGFQRVATKLKCPYNDVLDFDEWVCKMNRYYTICEQFVYFLVMKFRDGLLRCTTCEKQHWCDCNQICTGCLQVFNATPCPICKSYFGERPHKHKHYVSAGGTKA